MKTEITDKLKDDSKAFSIDTLGNVTYSLVAGAALDYFAGLNLRGIIASRASATALNSVTGGPYGFWREKIFKLAGTGEKSGKLRKSLTDLLAFNTFQVPIYGTAVAVGSLVSEGHVNWDKVKHGMAYLSAISPFIGPTLGIYMDGLRKFFGVKSAAEGAYGGKRK